MANFIDYRLGENISSEFQRTNTGKTRITALDNGMEVRNAQWKHHKLQFSATWASLSASARLDIESAFYAARAQLYLFRLRDYADCVADNEPLAVTAGSTAAVQLTRTYVFGPATRVRNIQAIVEATIHDADGHEVAGALDSALGIFTPSSAWDSATSYYWTGSFDVWVRFNSDELDTTMLDYDVSTFNVELIEQIARR